MPCGAMQGALCIDALRIHEDASDLKMRRTLELWAIGCGAKLYLGLDLGHDLSRVLKWGR